MVEPSNNNQAQNQNNVQSKPSGVIDKLREAAQAAGGEKGFKHGFKEALIKSPFLALSYFMLSVPLEIMINKTIKPAISKLYKKFKRDEAAEPPEVAQSLFSALRIFAWFPAVFMGDFLYHLAYGDKEKPHNSAGNSKTNSQSTNQAASQSCNNGKRCSDIRQVEDRIGKLEQEVAALKNGMSLGS